MDATASRPPRRPGQRTRVLNRVHRLLRELVPGGANRQLSSTQAGEILRIVRAVTAADGYRKQLARDLLDSLRRLAGCVQALTDQISGSSRKAGRS